MADFIAKETITLDQLDLLTALLEGYQEAMPEDDDDKENISQLLEKFYNLTDLIQTRSEYLSGNDWPENAKITLSCDDSMLK